MYNTNYKTIPSFPMFEICDTVHMEYAVRSIKTKEYCKVKDNGIGYPKVYLGKRKGGDGKWHYLHRLVAKTYISEIPEGMEIDHINRDIRDFRHINLKICSHKENLNNNLTLKQCIDSHKKQFTDTKIIKKMADKRKEYFSNIENRKKISKPVLQIDKISGEILNEYFGLMEAERQTNIKHNVISNCCKGKQKTAGGFLWQYKV